MALLRLGLLVLSLALSCGMAWAQSDAQPDVAAPEAPAKPSDKFPNLIFTQPDTVSAAMDIPPSSYADFWKNWHFVTVRWRQDTHEFRFAYANDLAWKTLSEHRTDYPVGAMFGKLAFPSEEDLALPSSVLASNRINRLEVMLWDPKNKKASSNGWVYLRFLNHDADPFLDKESTGILGVMSQKEIKSCVECHDRAYDRGFVFSQPLFLFRDPHHADEGEDKVLANRFGDLMHDMDAKQMPHIAVDLLHSLPGWGDRKVKAHEGDFFAGPLSELRPVLSKLALESPNTVFMIYDRDDPNTIELASTFEKKGYQNCVGYINLRGSGINPKEDNPLSASMQRRSLQQANTKTEAQGVTVLDLAKLYEPFAKFYTTCNGEELNSQTLPLLYTVKDKDGLPSYYFAPAKLD